MRNWLGFWLRAVRPYAYSTSVVPVAIGGLYARWLGEAFSWLRFAVALAAGMLLHTAANLWNDYFDFVCGVDYEGGGTGSGMLVSGALRPGRCFCAAVVCALLAAAGGVWLAVQVGWGILVLGAVGLAGAVGYCAGGCSPKHHALGEVWVFLMMGLGMGLGGYMAQTGRPAAPAVWISVPVGLLTVLLLYNNNMRDLHSDHASGIQTLPMKLNQLFHSWKAAPLFGILLLAAAYATLAGGLLLRLLPGACALAFGSLVSAGGWVAQIWTRPVTEQSQRTMAHVHILFGILMIIGLARVG
ncbi:MAG: prenyltransferase [Verrucomicrobiota bacterium]|jgi:1,4-dihydroxy-2-naphthoate octaprenyltransferase|nr:prenyltransferase [Verrucomicrobiota bacterium]